MKVLSIIAGILLIIGGLMVVFAKPLATLIVGQQYGMYDLGLIVEGMILVGVGVIVGLIAIIHRLVKKVKD